MRHPGRRLPVGAEVGPEGVDFRVWAPLRRRVEVAIESAESGRADVFSLTAEPGGYFSGRRPGLAGGARYRFRLDGGERFPDPASRFQPEGPHGPSEIVDPAAFRWSDAGWKGVSLPGQVFYEMHVGTFTPEGTFAAAAAQLPVLRDLGVTVLEIMPLGEFPGRFGWGYDGVGLFAPSRLYGGPDDFRAFVDHAHALGLGVILDVVFNHLGPDGNYLGKYSASYFSSREKTEWGEAINFDGPESAAVREFFVANAAYWLSEFHLDGLRLDATQNIHDRSPRHVLAEIVCAVRQAAAGRATIVVAENESQDARLVRPVDEGGFGLDGVWNDDFHHAALVALDGRRDAYHHDYLGTPQELISAAKYGYLYQGQRYDWQDKRRGTSTRGLPPRAFVTYLENHDQVANWGGQRLHQRTSPGRYRAMAALLLLGPGTPLLFQGQEFASSRRFWFFADHPGELGRAVATGRHQFLSQWQSYLANGAAPDPADPGVFEASKLDHAERDQQRAAWRLHQDLIRLRRQDPVLAGQGSGGLDGAVLTSSALALRFFGPAGDDRLLVVNLGRDLELRPAPEPLLAPPPDRPWRVVWSSNDPAYDGPGTPPVESDREGWRLPAESAVLLAPGERRWPAR